MTQLFKNQTSTISFADDGKIVSYRLGPFFECRDLGIQERTRSEGTLP
jgi:hypothetical protein